MFPEAQQVDSAIVLRNTDAFDKASDKNTYQSYQGFFEKYPRAEEAGEARTRYHRLLYQAKTSSGKLADYREFLNDYPDTWQRKDAEWQIFRISTGKNTVEAYRQFIQEFPDSYLVEKARLYAYSRADSDSRKDILNKIGFRQERKDSLQRIADLDRDLFILSHNGKYFDIINAAGTVIMDSIIKVSEKDKCEDLENMVLVMEPAKNKLINLVGNVVTTGDYTGYSILSQGFIKLRSGQEEEIIHLDGSPTSAKRYKMADMVAGFIVFSEKDQWGVESITGIPMVEPQFDTLYHFADNIVYSASGKWGVTPVQDFYPLLDQGKVDFELLYDSIAMVRGNQLYIEQEDKRGALDRQLRPFIPLREQYVELLDDGYFLDTRDSILDSRVAETWYLDIISNDDWTIGVRSDTSDLYYRGNKISEVTGAELLGRSAVIVSRGNKTLCYFNPQSKLEINESAEIKPIRKMGENSVIRHYLYTDQRNRQSVIDETGKRIKIPRFDRLIDLGEDYMIFSVKGFVYNILDNKGKVVLENVDAATSLDSGYISFLSNGKFGLLNIRNNTLIDAKYDKPMRRYDEERFIIEEGGKLGLIDRYDSLYLEPKYEEIHAINDSIAVLKANFRWTFWNINRGEIMLDNVSDYWEYNTDSGLFIKIFKGIGYGIWSPGTGLVLNSTYGELSLKSGNNELVFITEKWVEEADLVVLLYYDQNGELIRKAVLSTRQYESLQCQPEF